MSGCYKVTTKTITEIITGCNPVVTSVTKVITEFITKLGRCIFDYLVKTPTLLEGVQISVMSLVMTLTHFLNYWNYLKKSLLEHTAWVNY